ncbi:uncharacterized protein LOC135375939 isoform X2 [Ornithodoros turicata]
MLKFAFGLWLCMSILGTVISSVGMPFTYELFPESSEGHTRLGYTLLIAFGVFIIPAASVWALGALTKRSGLNLNRRQTETVSLVDTWKLPWRFWLLLFVLFSFSIAVPHSIDDVKDQYLKKHLSESEADSVKKCMDQNLKNHLNESRVDSADSSVTPTTRKRGLGLMKYFNKTEEELFVKLMDRCLKKHLSESEADSVKKCMGLDLQKYFNKSEEEPLVKYMRHFDKCFKESRAGLVHRYIVPYLIPAIALIVFPVFVDYTGWNLMWVWISVVVTAVCYVLLAFPSVTIWVPSVTMALASPLLYCGLLSAVEQYVPEHQLETAYALVLSAEDLAETVRLLVVDSLKYRWHVLAFFFAPLSVAFLAAFGLMLYDIRHGGDLNRRRRTMERFDSPEEPLHIEERASDIVEAAAG